MPNNKFRCHTNANFIPEKSWLKSYFTYQTENAFQELKKIRLLNESLGLNLDEWNSIT